MTPLLRHDGDLNLTSAGLCGRQKEIKQLNECLDRVVKFKSVEAVSVQGDSGAGKAALVSHVLGKTQSWHQTAVCFAKSDLQETNQEPHRAIVSCFASIVENLLESNEKDLWRSRILGSLRKSEICEIGRHAPGFCHLIDNHNATSKRDNNNHQDDDVSVTSYCSSSTHYLYSTINGGANRSLDFLRLALRSLARCLCSYTTLVLLLQHVNHVDSTCTQILQTIFKDRKAQNLLLVVTTSTLQAKQEYSNRNEPLVLDLPTLKWTHIQVGPLVLPDIQDLLVKTTRQQECTELAQLVGKTTGGNAKIVTQFLLKLCHKGLLECTDKKNGVWEWNMSRIQAETQDEHGALVHDLSRKARELPTDAQQALAHAACLGQLSFDMFVLQRIVHCMEMTANDPAHTQQLVNLEVALDTAVQAGLLERVGATSKYKFVNDNIQKSIRNNLLPQGVDLSTLHKQIGSKLLLMSKEEPDETSKNRLFLLAVHQLNIGASIMCTASTSQSLQLAELNHQAAEIAFHRAYFFTASTFCQSGLDSLPRQERWSEHYDLALKLAIMRCNVLYSMGKLVECEATARSVLVEARGLSDQLDPYRTLVFCLLQQQRGEDAMRTMREVLRKLGVTIPGKTHVKFATIRRSLQVQATLRRRGVEFMRSLAPVQDLWGEKRFDFLNLLVEVAVTIGDHDMQAFAMTMSTSQTIQHGASKSVAVDVILMATQSAILGNHDLAAKICDIGYSLMDDLTPLHYRVKARVLTNFFVEHWRKPLTLCLDEALEIKDLVLEAGIVDELFYTSLAYGFFYFDAGLNLIPLENDLKKAVELLLDFDFYASTALLEPFLQMIQNLQGKSADPTVLTGDTMNQDEALRRSVNTKNQRSNQVIQMYRMFLCYIFNDTKQSLEMSKEMFSTVEEGPSPMLRPRLAFQALAHLAKAHETGKARYARKGKSYLRCLEKMLSHGCPNVYHYVALVRAEHYSFVHRNSSDLAKLCKAYDMAIAASGRLGILHVQAMSNERAGLFFLRRKETSWASIYLSRAHALYKDWGGVGKARQMEVMHHHDGVLLSDDDSDLWKGTCLRARERLDLNARVRRSKSLNFGF